GFHRREHIVAVGARLTMTLAHVMQLVVEIKPPGVLRMALIDNVDKRGDPTLRIAQQHHRSHDLSIDFGDLLTRAQIGNRCGPLVGNDPIRKTATGASAIKAQDEAGALWCSTMDEGIDAQCTMQAEKPRWNMLYEFKARPPDQRAIAENPQVLGRV